MPLCHAKLGIGHHVVRLTHTNPSRLIVEEVTILWGSPKVEIKDPVIPYLDTVLLESLGFCDIDAGFLLGTDNVPHPDPQRCLFLPAVA